MSLILNCANKFQKYVGYNYTFILDCEISIDVMFASQHFHHLAGLQHLTDIAQLNIKQNNNTATGIFKDIKRGKIKQSLIESSSFYSKIYDRLSYFTKFDEVISSKLIVDFDYTKVPKSKIMSKYLLYRQYGDTYVMLGLKFDNRRQIFVPETFIVESSDYYIKDQVSYNVKEVKCEKYSGKKNNNLTQSF